MPPKPYLDVLGNAAGMRPDPGLMRLEDDPDLEGKRALFVAGIPTVKSSPVACDERTVDDPAADRFKMARPSSPPGRIRDRVSILMGWGG